MYRRAASVLVAITVLTLAGGVVVGGTVSAESDPETDTAPCTAKVVRSAFFDFLVAFNRGEYATLDQLFALPPEFVAFSSRKPGHRLRGQRDTLLAYFQARHRQEDRLARRTFSFNGNSPQGGQFDFGLWRSAQDYDRGAWFSLIGKGSATCDREGKVSFVVLTLGPPRTDSDSGKSR